MAAAYTKEFLVDAFVSRYKDVKVAYDLRAMANQSYDTLGKDKFRVACALDAEAIRVYKQSIQKAKK